MLILSFISKSSKTRCFTAYVPPVKYLKTTFTCSRSLIPATGVEMIGAASLRLQGTTNTHKYIHTPLSQPHTMANPVKVVSRNAGLTIGVLFQEKATVM